MAIILNKQGKYAESIKYLCKSLGIKETAKAYFLRSIAFQNLPVTIFEYVKQAKMDIKMAY